MNERIKQLALHAGLNFDGYGVYVPTSLALQETVNLQKFAELIVKECAKFLDENSGSDQCNNVWYPTPEEMLQHFGVEL